VEMEDNKEKGVDTEAGSHMALAYLMEVAYMDIDS
tara:strand:+ start:458 stop:562 length:105 start_codon:yes stop_codon:yes gene_type:complete